MIRQITRNTGKLATSFNRHPCHHISPVKRKPVVIYDDGKYMPFFGNGDTTYVESSHVKGIIGEMAVATAISLACPDWDVINRANVPRESDIHMVNPKNGNMIVFECKNKSTITKADITKSIRDLKCLKSKYGSRITGYMFVSLRSSVIPNNHNFFEVIDGTPTIWMGVEEHMHQKIPNIIAMLARIISSGDLSDIDTLSRKINDVHDTIKNNKKDIDQSVARVTELLIHIKNLEESNHALWRSISAIVPE